MAFVTIELILFEGIYALFGKLVEPVQSPAVESVELIGVKALGRIKIVYVAEYESGCISYLEILLGKLLEYGFGASDIEAVIG